jgi:hypothetical protein
MSVTVPEYTGCLWPVDPACLDGQWEDYTEEIQNRALALASETLHRLTGYRVGGCPLTLRPVTSDTTCPPHPIYAYGNGSFNPFINQFGQWVNACGITKHCEVDLPAPVGRVDEVKVSGVVLTPTDYRIDNGHLLTWQGAGPCPWSEALTQDPTAPDTDPNTMSVTYLNAYPVDGLGAYAVGILAMEYAKACVGTGKCRLPATVTAVTRGGVSYEVASGAFPDGFTGIREVDTFISLWNPQALRQRSSVWSPDIAQPRVIG